MQVSVIIPSYNSENFIGKAIDSVLNQTFQNFEIIVIDDGSTDNTKEIINKCQDPRVKYIYQDNAGASSARNTGIKNAKGDYIAFLDADDIWLKTKLEEQMNVIQSQKDVCLVFCAFELLDEVSGKKTFYKDYKNYKNNNELIQNLLLERESTIPYPSTVLIKKEILDKTEYFNPELEVSEDYDLWLKLAAHQNFYCINKILVIRYRPINSLTAQINLKVTEKCFFSVVENFFNDTQNKYINIKKTAYANTYFSLAEIYFYANKKSPDLKYIINLLSNSLKNDPSYIFKIVFSKRKVRLLIWLFLFTTGLSKFIIK